MLNILASDNPALSSWQETLSGVVTDPAELCRLLNLDVVTLDIPPAALRQFPLRVPLPFLARMRKGDRNDPLLLQVLPQHAELLEAPGYVEDPLQENRHNPVPGLLHKYRGRVLLMPTASCAIHCRYCFRRHFPYEGNIPGKNQWEESLGYLKADTSIHEVILSGGDPMTLSDRHLFWLIEQLEAIPHLIRLRFHTRLPVMIPARVTEALCARLASSRLQGVVVLHSNHAQELDHEVREACLRLRDAGLTLLNQSVLLRAVNDDAGVLRDLSESLFSMGVLPYYLHVPDKTRGTAHFGISDNDALELQQTLQCLLPGYLVPRLVREAPGQPSKTLLYP